MRLLLRCTITHAHARPHLSSCCRRPSPPNGGYMPPPPPASRPRAVFSPIHTRRTPVPVTKKRHRSVPAPKKRLLRSPPPPLPRGFVSAGQQLMHSYRATSPAETVAGVAAATSPAASSSSSAVAAPLHHQPPVDKSLIIVDRGLPSEPSSATITISGNRGKSGNIIQDAAFPPSVRRHPPP